MKRIPNYLLTSAFPRYGPMGDRSKISWTSATWPVATGCRKISEGCRGCYAEREWHRLVHLPAYSGRAFTDVATHPDRLMQPLHWRRPRRIFVCPTSDLFHETIQDAFIDDVFAVMAMAPHHVFQVLTKRPERMHAFLTSRPQRLLDWWRTNVGAVAAGERGVSSIARHAAMSDREPRRMFALPLPNVWLGVSVENQATAAERLPILMSIPAAIRWVSAEPLLGPLDLSDWLGDGRRPVLDWVVVGGESGPRARIMQPAWARDLRQQCQLTDTAFFFKQTGSWVPVAPEEPSIPVRRGGAAHMENGVAFTKVRGGGDDRLDGELLQAYPQCL